MVQYVEAEIKKNEKISLKLDAWRMFKFKLTKPINISNRIQITLTYNSNIYLTL